MKYRFSAAHRMVESAIKAGTPCLMKRCMQRWYQAIVSGE
jgi:hypothetical protein